MVKPGNNKITGEFQCVNKIQDMLDFVWIKEERLGRALFNLILAMIYR